MKTNQKILSLTELLKLTAKKQAAGKRIVLSSGHFNVIHPGHLRFLNYSKKQGDLLIV